MLVQATTKFPDAPAVAVMPATCAPAGAAPTVSVGSSGWPFAPSHATCTLLAPPAAVLAPGDQGVARGVDRHGGDAIRGIRVDRDRGGNGRAIFGEGFAPGCPGRAR